MTPSDDFTDYVREFVSGRYDCVDRIVLNGYFSMGQTSGGLLTWWNRLFPGTPLDQQGLREMAGDFSRRVYALAKKRNIMLIHCPIGQKDKHALAEKHVPADPNFQGVFLILVAKAPALVWEAKNNPTGQLVLRRPKKWPLVNHFHFHIIDQEWGHITFKMSCHPPFGVQIILNGHEWVQRQAHRQSISWVKEGNCFVGGSDLKALDQLAEGLSGSSGIARLAAVCDRWIYSACLCLALNLEQQQRSQFQYQYSCYQLEYSRNLLFESGRRLDQVYQGLIDRTRRLLDVPRLKTVFGRKRRPYKTRAGGGRLEMILDSSVHDLTVFKVHFGKLTLKMYDKTDAVLRTEIIVNNVEELRCGKRLEKVSSMLERLQRMIIEFLGVVQAAHLSFLDGSELDRLPQPSVRGQQRVAGVDLQKERMRTVVEAVVALAAMPEGFTAEQLARQVQEKHVPSLAGYHGRKAAYDLRKLRAKGIAQRKLRSRRYSIQPTAIRILAGLLTLTDHVIKPVLAGVARPKRGRPPKTIHPLDVHYQKLQHEMLATLRTLKLVA